MKLQESLEESDLTAAGLQLQNFLKEANVNQPQCPTERMLYDNKETLLRSLCVL